MRGGRSALVAIGAAGLIWTRFVSQAGGGMGKANDAAAPMTAGRADGAVDEAHGMERMIEACVEMMRQGMPGMMRRSAANRSEAVTWCCGGAMGWWMILSSVALVALVGVGVILLIRAVGAARSSHPGTGARSEALRILEERYARGEIDGREFEQRRRALRSEEGEE